MPHTMTTPGLWPSMFFLERGWLSANNIVFLDADAATIVDTGYCIHAEQTLSLVRSCIGTRPLGRILNTHLHSATVAAMRRCRPRGPRYRPGLRQVRRNMWPTGTLKR